MRRAVKINRAVVSGELGATSLLNLLKRASAASPRLVLMGALALIVKQRENLLESETKRAEVLLYWSIFVSRFFAATVISIVLIACIVGIRVFLFNVTLAKEKRRKIF